MKRAGSRTGVLVAAAFVAVAGLAYGTTARDDGPGPKAAGFGSAPVHGDEPLGPPGDPVALTPESRARIDGFGRAGGSRLTGGATLVGRRDGHDFFRLPRAGGGFCYSVARAPERGGEARDVGAIVCAPAFPSAELPLLDFSVFEASTPGARDLRVVALRGFASRDVAVVAAAAGDGRVLARARVVDGTYALRDVPEGAARVLALDGRGRTLFALPG